MSDHHRKKANKKRNGKTRYEKGRHLHDRHPKKPKSHAYTTSSPYRPTEKAATTLGDLWPER